MSATFESLGLGRLSVDERLQVLEELWADLTPAVETTEIPQSLKDELDRRLVAHEADPSRGSTWTEVKARLRVRYGWVETS